MYNSEVFTSVIWGCVIRCREAQSAVKYPAELDDEFIFDEPDDLPEAQQQPDGQVSFMKGWNFTTDMYRTLEHAVDRFRRRRAGGSTNSLRNLLDQSAISSSPEAILDLVEVMHSNLHPRFKETHQSGDPIQDRLNIQTANIIATTQLLRMVVLGGELEEASGEKRCQVAGELLDAFSTIPVRYQRAISAPLVIYPAFFGRSRFGTESYIIAVPARGYRTHTWLRYRGSFTNHLLQYQAYLVSPMHHRGTSDGALK